MIVPIERGEIWWADLPEPRGSEPGFPRPVLILQSASFNRSRIRTVIVAGITTNLDAAKAPGNVPIPARTTGLPKDSVVNVSQLITVDRSYLTKPMGMLSTRLMAAVDNGLRLILNL